jgi:Protein of unknown function (DUF2799)
MLRLAALLIAAIASGCASLDRAECLSANWYAIGLEDGARGRPLERLGDHRRACAEHKVVPDAERYVAGRDEGLKSFCTYERGFSHGRSGQSYSGGCPAALAVSFQSGYQLGRELHELHRRLADVQSQIARSKAMLKDGIPSARQRALEVERLEDLTRESAELEARIQGITQR